VSAPPSALIARFMCVFCANLIRRHDKGFNLSISRLASDRPAVSAECPIKRYVLR
jgi:hypothetical protein